MKSAGGKLGRHSTSRLADTDAFVLVDAPDYATAASASLAINGAVRRSNENGCSPHPRSID